MYQTNGYLLANLILTGETLRSLVDKDVLTKEEALKIVQDTQLRLKNAPDMADLEISHHLDNLEATFK